MNRNPDDHTPSQPDETDSGPRLPLSTEANENQRGKPGRKRRTMAVGIAGFAVLCGAGAWAILPQVPNSGQREAVAATTQPAPALTATARPTPTLRLTDYTEPVHGFTVKFLSPPEHKKETLQLTAQTTAIADLFNPENSGQSVMALPLPCMDPARTTDVLQATMDATVRTSGNAGKPGSAPPVVETQERTTVQSFPAIRGKFTYTDNDNRRLTAQTLIVMHGSTIIQAIALSGASPDPVLDAGQKTFMESLSFLDRPAPTAPMCTDPSQLPGVSAG